ncbi:uncharacterized protein LOC126900593 isoform X1 [Daktulosphaira vitifoliae]|uniref:uncharacterized protein LOC126900593 isoform X1 n=1 Tax=Daktulosphaira vitifoliae TaxID=58002 RepID=UPI0021AA7B52|nr:uncharacterized protein LOC126900593 isoform X1 [Daktulosphaira vitifoliae]
MNILFRKNFQTEGTSKERSYTSGLGRRTTSGNTGALGTVRRTRESRCSAMADPDHTCPFRTHILLGHANFPQEFEDFVGPPLLTAPKQTSAVPLIRWIRRKQSTGKADTISNTPSFSNGTNSFINVANSNNTTNDKGCRGRHGSYSKPNTPTGTSPQMPLHVRKVDSASISNLDKDCFIIPIAYLDRFLPDGVNLPISPSINKPNSLNMVEVDDPKTCLMFHMMTILEPIDPILESPLSDPMARQTAAACSLLNEIAGTKVASEGMLLANLEKDAVFPFITYYVLNKSSVSNPREVAVNVRNTTLKKFDPRAIKHTTDHTFDLFTEVANIVCPPISQTKRPRGSHTAYIISVYKVFDGDDSEKFEKHWLYWTGARMIYNYLPKSTGLRRITLHKSQSNGDKQYVLMCECSNLLQDFTSIAKLLPALKARLCGCTGVYRSIFII